MRPADSRPKASARRSQDYMPGSLRERRVAIGSRSRLAAETGSSGAEHDSGVCERASRRPGAARPWRSALHAASHRHGLIPEPQASGLSECPKPRTAVGPARLGAMPKSEVRLTLHGGETLTIA